MNPSDHPAMVREVQRDVRHAAFRARLLGGGILGGLFFVPVAVLACLHPQPPFHGLTLPALLAWYFAASNLSELPRRLIARRLRPRLEALPRAAVVEALQPVRYVFQSDAAVAIAERLERELNAGPRELVPSGGSEPARRDSLVVPTDSRTG